MEVDREIKISNPVGERSQLTFETLKPLEELSLNPRNAWECLWNTQKYWTDAECGELAKDKWRSLEMYKEDDLEVKFKK